MSPPPLLFLPRIEIRLYKARKYHNGEKWVQGLFVCFVCYHYLEHQHRGCKGRKPALCRKYPKFNSWHLQVGLEKTLVWKTGELLSISVSKTDLGCNPRVNIGCARQTVLQMCHKSHQVGSQALRLMQAVAQTCGGQKLAKYVGPVCGARAGQVHSLNKWGGWRDGGLAQGVGWSQDPGQIFTPSPDPLGLAQATLSSASYFAGAAPNCPIRAAGAISG